MKYITQHQRNACYHVMSTGHKNTLEKSLFEAALTTMCPVLLINSFHFRSAFDLQPTNLF